MEKRLSIIVAAFVSIVSPADLPGDACLPKDVVNLLGSDLTLNAGKACRRSKKDTGACGTECRDALYALKAARCFAYISQSQRLQPRGSGVTLAAMAGRWYGSYPASGLEMLEMSYEPATSTLSGIKLTGNNFVPAGKTSWEATPVGCSVASSLYAGKFTGQWDPCTLTMLDHDHMIVDLGGPNDDGLQFVRAKLPLLLAWDDENVPTRGLLAHLEMCGIEAEDAQTSFREWATLQLHHSTQSVLLDQALIAFPLLLLGGWFGAGDAASRPILIGVCTTYLSVLSARLAYLGFAL